MMQLLQDVKYSARSLLKTWGFTAVAVAMLALGIGATTTVCSVANVLLFRPLNGGASADGELVRVYSRSATKRGYWRRFSYPNFEDLRARRDLFGQLAAETLETVGVLEAGSTRRVMAGFVSADFFPMLRVSMARGRSFTSADDQPGAPPVAIASHAFWTSRGADPGLVGQTVMINGRACTVVGIAPEGFTGTAVVIAPQLWLPMSQLDGLSFLSSTGARRRAQLLDRDNHQLDVVGRLAPGVTLAAAATGLDALSAAMEQAHPAENRDQKLVVLRNSRTSADKTPRQGADPFATTVFFALAMAAALLLVASLNLANMLLARGGVRQREIAVRLAMGAGRWRVVRLLLVEASLLALAGGVAGIWIAFGACQVIAAAVRSFLPTVGVVFDAAPDTRILAATLAFCACATAVFGVGPALSLSRADIIASLKERVGSQPAGGGRGRVARHALVVAQIALSLALLTAGGLFLFGALRAASANPGFTLEGGVVARLDATFAGYDEARTRETFSRVVERLRSTPGVVSASLAHTTPYGERNFDRDVQPAGAEPGTRGINAQYRVIGADYFRTLGVTVVRGREFTLAEEAAPTSSHPVIVDTEFARRMWPDEDPIGRHVQWARLQPGTPTTTYEVVGVAASLKVKLFDRSPRAHIYVPTGENYQPALMAHVRVASAGPGGEARMLRAVETTIRGTDPNLPIVAVQTLRGVRDSGVEAWFVRLAAQVFAVLGLIALAVAAVGLYAVRAFLVGRRTREFGIRFAIGATAWDVMRMVMKEGASIIAVGLCAGLLLSAGVSRMVAGWVYGVRAFEPIVFATTAMLLTAAMLVACYLPARRATAVPPAVALRQE